MEATQGQPNEEKKVNAALERMIARLAGMTNLPTLPIVVDRLAEAMRDPDADARTIAVIVEDDQVLMARILRLVNSVMFAGAEKVTSLPHAVARIGMNAVSNVVTSSAVFSTLDSIGSASFNREAFWRHSIITGIAGSVVNERAKKRLGFIYGNDLLHLAGLVHDIGKVIFEHYYHEDFDKAVAFAKENQVPLITAETQVMGVDHTEIGLWLAQKWKMGREIQEVIRWHHEPADSDASLLHLVAMIHAGNCICNWYQLGDGGDPVPVIAPGVWELLGMTENDVEALVEQINLECSHSEMLAALSRTNNS